MRELHVDFIKGWAMISIVFFHITTGFNSGDLVLVSTLLGNPWNVPIFFIIAGFFINNDKLSSPLTFLRAKFNSLYIPATIIYISSVLFHNVFVKIGWYPYGAIHPGNKDPFHYYGFCEIVVRCIKALLCAGSGELVMGAMWFLYVLIYAFVGLSLISFILKKIIEDKKRQYSLRFLIIFLFASLSCYLSFNGYTIKRVNVTFTAMLLIEVGGYVRQKLCWKYDNGYIAMGCLLVFLHCVVMGRTQMTLANNQYQDLIILIVGSCSAIYLWGWGYKKISSCWLPGFVCLVGRESLYVMMLHIVGLFLCNNFFECLNIFTIESPRGMYTYNLMSNPLWITIYLFFGIGFPLVSISTFRRLKKYLIAD